MFQWSREKYMFGNFLKRERLSSNSTDLDLLAGIQTTISELEGEELGIPTERETGITPRAKILKIAKQDILKTSRLIHTWLHDR